MMNIPKNFHTIGGQSTNWERQHMSLVMDVFTYWSDLYHKSTGTYRMLSLTCSFKLIVAKLLF